MRKVLIFSKRNDEFVNNVVDWIGSDFVFRLGDNLEFELISFKILNGEIEGVFTTKYSQISFNEIESVWYNGGVINQSNNRVSEALNSFLIHNRTLITNAVLYEKGGRAIGTLENNKESNKIHSLLVAKKNGLTVPKTLITKSKKELTRFIENTKTLINKRISESDFFEEEGKMYDISKTVLINKATLEKIPDVFELSFFQEKIEREYEIRTIFFNDEFYSSAIFEKEGIVDYRVNLRSFDEKPRIIPYKLPEVIELKLRNVMKELNLSCGSIDLIYSKNNQFYFLEVNPVGQISFINNMCNYYLECLFAKYLKNEVYPK